MVEYIGDVITGKLMEYFEANGEELSKQDCHDLERAVNNVLVHFHDNIVSVWREDDEETSDEGLEEQYAFMCAYHKEIDEWIQQMVIDYKSNTAEYIQLINNTLPDEYYREYINFPLIAFWM